MTALLRRFAPSLLLVAAACGDGEFGSPREEIVPHDLTVALGSTDRPREFVEVNDGDELPIEFGFQGGYHIWGAFRVEDVAPLDVAMRFELYDGDELVGAADYIDDAFEQSDGVWIYGGVTVFIFNDVDPIDLDGRELRMTVEVEDSTGGIGRDEHRIIASADAVR